MVLLCDLATRSIYLSAHYTDSGLLPRNNYLTHFAHSHYFSFHLAHGGWWFQAILFVIAAAFLICMMLGHRTRWFTFLSWVMLVSLQNRNPILLNSADMITRVLMFWAMFLPLGACYSMDKAFATEQNPHHQICNTASATLLLQVGILYLFTAIAKIDTQWQLEGTDYTFLLAGSFIFIAFSPIFFLPLRYIAIISIVILHIIAGLSMKWGILPYINMASMIIFTPSHLWEKVAHTFNKPLDKWKIYYDGDCYFCQQSLKLLKMLLFIEQIPSYPAQSIITAKAQMEKENSWVITNSRNSYYRFEAFRQMLSLSPLFSPLFPVLKYPWIHSRGTLIYLWVSSHRKILSSIFRKFAYERSMCAKNYWPTNIALLFLMGCVIAWNINTHKLWEIPLDPNIEALMHTLRLNQKWDIYPPN